MLNSRQSGRNKGQLKGCGRTLITAQLAVHSSTFHIYFNYHKKLPYRQLFRSNRMLIIYSNFA
ncbi:hypothetical protein T07_3770 [Trichinella nelsoni]|uniref:Uncharacterized protein n=1 Tax=Trichinella nelsoni TaxID=6336 RepID=A0A0V0RLL7_9BILA|nr:hypothetical protein T07_3770 [Trichinella nelsoni]